MAGIPLERKAEIKKIIEDNGLYWKASSEIWKEQNISFLEVDFVSFFDWLNESYKQAAWAILYTPAEKFYILINKSLPSTRKRFTSAHELGHYFLHRDFLMSKWLYAEQGGAYLFSRSGWWDGLYSTMPEEDINREMEANEFAAELLMPESKVAEVFKKLKDEGVGEIVDEMARVFEVSLLAMTYRLVNLGLKDNG